MNNTLQNYKPLHQGTRWKQKSALSMPVGVPGTLIGTGPCEVVFVSPFTAELAEDRRGEHVLSGPPASEPCLGRPRGECAWCTLVSTLRVADRWLYNPVLSPAVTLTRTQAGISR